MTRQPTKSRTSTRRTRTARPAATPNAAAFLDGLFDGDAEWRALVEKARLNRDVAHALHDLRIAHGLTQKELAARVGTTQSVIARLENADYEGHSLSMLGRIAAALQQQVQVTFVPVTARPQRKPAAPSRTRGNASSSAATPKPRRPVAAPGR